MYSLHAHSSVANLSSQDQTHWYCHIHAKPSELSWQKISCFTWKHTHMHLKTNNIIVMFTTGSVSNDSSDRKRDRRAPGQQASLQERVTRVRERNDRRNTHSRTTTRKANEGKDWKRRPIASLLSRILQHLHAFCNLLSAHTAPLSVTQLKYPNIPTSKTSELPSATSQECDERDLSLLGETKVSSFRRKSCRKRKHRRRMTTSWPLSALSFTSGWTVLRERVLTEAWTSVCTCACSDTSNQTLLPARTSKNGRHVSRCGRPDSRLTSPDVYESCLSHLLGRALSVEVQKSTADYLACDSNTQRLQMAGWTHHKSSSVSLRSISPCVYNGAPVPLRESVRL